MTGNVCVTIIQAKIFYAQSTKDLDDVISNAISNNVIVGSTNNYPSVSMSEEQFVRFKNAGKRHASANDKSTPSGFSRQRSDRTSSSSLEKWDVDEYGELTGVKGPWGSGSLTNRDHMTANSSNQLQFKNSTWPGSASTSSKVKSEGLAITVSGKHHREASYTYGGRTKKTDTVDGSTRMVYGANFPTESFETETIEMLQWKSYHMSNGSLKSTIRIEMVGGYAYMYKLASRKGYIKASQSHDAMLIYYLNLAVSRDDGVERR